MIHTGLGKHRLAKGTTAIASEGLCTWNIRWLSDLVFLEALGKGKKDRM